MAASDGQSMLLTEAIHTPRISRLGCATTAVQAISADKDNIRILFLNLLLLMCNRYVVDVQPFNLLLNLKHTVVKDGLNVGFYGFVDGVVAVGFFEFE